MNDPNIDHVTETIARHGYPHTPAYSDTDTSYEAALTIDAETLRSQVLAVLTRPMTADECAAALGMSVLSVRPRFTESYKLGLITPTGERRRNISGRMAKVWRRVGEQQSLF